MDWPPSRAPPRAARQGPDRPGAQGGAVHHQTRRLQRRMRAHCLSGGAAGWRLAVRTAQEGCPAIPHREGARTTHSEERRPVPCRVMGPKCCKAARRTAGAAGSWLLRRPGVQSDRYGDGLRRTPAVEGGKYLMIGSVAWLIMLAPAGRAADRCPVTKRSVTRPCSLNAPPIKELALDTH